MDTKYIGLNIKKLRDEHGMTQSQLAERLNVSFQAVSKWECGTTVPDVSIIPEIAGLFGVTIDFLFRESSVNYKNKALELLTLYENDMDNTEAFEKANSAYLKLFDRGDFDSEDLFYFARLNELRMDYYRLKALRYYEISIEKKNSRSDSAYYKAQRQYIAFLAKTGKADTAVSFAQKEYENDPDNVYTSASLVFAYHSGKMNEKAKATAEKALLRFPGNALLLTFAGDIEKALGNGKKATEYWNQAFASDGEMIDSQYSLAKYLFESGETDEALKIFQLILDWNQNHGTGSSETITFTDLNMNNMKNADHNIIIDPENGAL